MDERQFLHDIAGPIGTAMFLLDATLDTTQNRVDADPDEIAQLGQVYQALEKVKKLLQERREVLIKRGIPNARA